MNDDEELAFIPTDRLIVELCKRFDTAIFIGDQNRRPGENESSFAFYDRRKDSLRLIGLLDFIKARFLASVQQASRPLPFSDSEIEPFGEEDD